jgi:glucokinase
MYYINKDNQFNSIRRVIVNDGKIVIGVDLGGTRLRTAQLDTRLHILKREEILSLAHEGLDALIERIKHQIRLVLPSDFSQVMGIGVSVPGPLNPVTGVVVAPPNLPGWHNVPLQRILQEEFSCPIYLGNDATVACLAETLRGAAQGFRHVIFITVSTGVGGGAVVDGLLLNGKSGLATEFGHLVIIADGEHVSSIEREAAGPALIRRVKRLLAEGQSSMITGMVNGNLDEIHGGHIGDAALQGDAVALDAVNYSAHIMGLGIVTLLHAFNPEVIVMGGGVVNGLGNLYLDRMWQTIRKHALDPAYWQDLVIVPATLAEDVSVIGSASLVLTKGGLTNVSEVAQLIMGQG